MRWSTRRPQLPEPQGHRRRTLQPRRRKHRRRFWLIVAGVILTGLAALGVDLALRYLPAIRALDDGRTAAAQAQSLMQRGVDKLGDSDLSQLQSLLIRAQGDFGGKSRVIETSWLLDIAGRLPFAGDQVNALRGLRDTGSASAQLGLDALPMLRDVRGGDSGGSALGRLTAFSENNGGAIDRLSHDLDAVDAAVAQIPTNAQLLGPLGSGRALMQSLVPRLDSIRPALGVLKLLPFAAGSGQHRYLLLLDNPGEERPGGGFIGAVGEVTLAQGAVTSKLFRSSDFANSLVTGISAPAPLDQTLFHGKPWELSDSNWSPDFPTAAAQAARFYQAATGESVDGVIGVDPVALGYVLAVTGPVSVPPYPQTVDAQNALLELNEIINKARPGDPGKVYLAPFGDAVTTRVLSAPLGEDPDIAAALLRAAQGKHLVLDFNDPTLMAAADGAGFTGRISDPLSDMLQVVDANVGANKADLFVTRSYSLDATVSDNGEVADTLTLTYHNPAQTDPALQSLVSQFGGAYHDYVRAYVPESASLQSMKVQAGSGPVTSVSPSSIDYELQREAIGFLLVVPPGQTVTLTLTYAGPFADASSQPVQYAMSWGKEIGAPAWPVQLTVHIDGRQQAFSTTLDGDRTWSLSG